VLQEITQFLGSDLLLPDFHKAGFESLRAKARNGGKDVGKLS
jgi:hypothetical protein